MIVKFKHALKNVETDFTVLLILGAMNNLFHVHTFMLFIDNNINNVKFWLFLSNADKFDMNIWLYIS